MNPHLTRTIRRDRRGGGEPKRKEIIKTNSIYILLLKTMIKGEPVINLTYRNIILTQPKYSLLTGSLRKLAIPKGLL